jgi:hypothetical protein
MYWHFLQTWYRACWIHHHGSVSRPLSVKTWCLGRSWDWLPWMLYIDITSRYFEAVKLNCSVYQHYTKAVCRIREFTLLLRVTTSWRCGDGLFFEVPPLASDAIKRSIHFSKTCCRQFITSKYLATELPFHGWKSPETAWGEIWTVWRMFWWGSTDPLFPSRTRTSIPSSPHAISGLFQPWKGSSEARNFEVINGLQHVFEKWAERFKKCIACQGRYFENNRLSPHLHKVPTRSYKVSPRTLQKAIVKRTTLLNTEMHVNRNS